MTTRRKFASMRAAFALCDRLICFLSSGTVISNILDHSANVGGLEGAKKERNIGLVKCKYEIPQEVGHDTKPTFLQGVHLPF